MARVCLAGAFGGKRSPGQTGLRVGVESCFLPPESKHSFTSAGGTVSSAEGREAKDGSRLPSIPQKTPGKHFPSPSLYICIPLSAALAFSQSEGRSHLVSGRSMGEETDNTLREANQLPKQSFFPAMRCTLPRADTWGDIFSLAHQAYG